MTLPWLSAARRDWREIGGLGRLALTGLAAAVLLTVVLGFGITRAAESHLLDARATQVHAIVQRLPLLAVDRPLRAQELTAYDAAIKNRVLGGENERVKVWLADGTIVYSDARELIGESFELSATALAAFAGSTGSGISDLADPAHELNRAAGELIEIYIPIVDEAGQVLYVVEVEQDVSALNSALSRIGRNVWVSISSGLAFLGLFLGVLAIARARSLNERRRQAESLLRSSFDVQEEERRRIVGALHDDVGQPLYRLLYGLEGSRAKLEDDDPVADELARLEEITRGIDKTLRKELRLLHHGLAADVGLETALDDLVELTRREAGLDANASVALAWDISSVQRTALYRAAQEAVTNVRKHAGASRVDIRVGTEGGVVSLEVDDDGTGVVSRPGLGLTTMRERFDALGGGVEVLRRPGGGTRLRCWLPRTEFP